jgi:hypothetical protein
MNRLASIAIMAIALLGSAPGRAAESNTVTVGGVAVPATTVVEGKTLVHNGSGTRKRGYFLTDVTSVYLAEKRDTMEGVETVPGPKRLQLVLLRDLPGSTIERYFMSDFRMAATDAEFKQLIREVGLVGSVYGRIKMVHKGDTVHMDWVPGKGMRAAINGQPLMMDEQSAGQQFFINSEMLYRIFLRMYIGGQVNQELRDNLLGRSRSMMTASTQ